MIGRLARYTTVVCTFAESGATLSKVPVTVLATSRADAIERATILGADPTARDTTVDITGVDDVIGGAS